MSVVRDVSLEVIAVEMNESLQLLIENFSRSVQSDLVFFHQKPLLYYSISCSCATTTLDRDKFVTTVVDSAQNDDAISETSATVNGNSYLAVHFKSASDYSLIFCKHESMVDTANWLTICKCWLETNCHFINSIVRSLICGTPIYPLESNKFDHTIDIPMLDQITSIFEAQLLKRVNAKGIEDCWVVRGREKFQADINYFVSRNWPIQFVLPAFPFKSSNTTTKVIGDQPDMGEKLALLTLESFLNAVGQVYSPGGYLTIFSDGRVYCDICEIPDATVTRFRQSIHNLVNSELIRWSDLDLFFPDLTDSDKRVALVNLFGTTKEAILHRVRTDADFHEIYCGFKRFMCEELSVPANWSGKKVDREMAVVAKRLMMRNFSYGNLVKILFPHHVRLSIHPSNNAVKFSVNLINHTTWGTPWHNCALLHPNGHWSLVRKREAEEKGYQLCHSPDNLAYYKVPH